MDRVNELCDFLYEKGMSQESFLEMADWQELHSSYDMTSYCRKIYELFSYIGLNNDQIEMFIVNNKKIFLEPFDEIRKIAYVLKKVDMHDEMFKAKRSSASSSQYKKIFMRNLLFEKGNKYADGCGVYGLIEGERKAYDQYGLSILARDVFNKTICSDYDLEQFLNKHLIINDKIVSVDEYIDKKSMLFYSEFIRKTKMSKTRK